MQKDRLILMFWFAGIVGFFLVFSTIFISMIPLRERKQIIVYEPNSVIFWSELIIMLVVLYITLWILYNYITGKGHLQLQK